eukprot:13408511-Alexandrium_andersonii.AAC.1
MSLICDQSAGEDRLKAKQEEINAIASPVMANLFQAKQKQDREQGRKAEAKNALEGFCHSVRDMLYGAKLRLVFEVGEDGMIEK